jgi:hypothetical protein
MVAMTGGVGCTGILVLACCGLLNWYLKGQRRCGGERHDVEMVHLDDDVDEHHSDAALDVSIDNTIPVDNTIPKTVDNDNTPAEVVPGIRPITDGTIRQRPTSPPPQVPPRTPKTAPLHTPTQTPQTQREQTPLPRPQGTQPTVDPVTRTPRLTTDEMANLLRQALADFNTPELERNRRIITSTPNQPPDDYDGTTLDYTQPNDDYDGTTVDYTGIHDDYDGTTVNYTQQVNDYDGTTVNYTQPRNDDYDGSTVDYTNANDVYDGSTQEYVEDGYMNDFVSHHGTSTTWSSYSDVYDTGTPPP